jgi:ATP-dependent Lhr-like helicase
LLIGTINDAPANEHFLARFLEQAGFVNTTLGFQMRRVMTAVAAASAPPAAGDDGEDDILESA